MPDHYLSTNRQGPNSSPPKMREGIFQSRVSVCWFAFTTVFFLWASFCVGVLLRTAPPSHTLLTVTPEVLLLSVERDVPGVKSASVEAEDDDDDDDDDEEEDEICDDGVDDCEEDDDNPVGESLLIDIRGLPSEWLGSSQQIAESMVSLVATKTDLTTLLSKHCNDLPSGSVHCVGSLWNGAISIRSFPSSGNLILDIFVGNTILGIPFLERVEKMFHVDDENVTMDWMIKARGFSRLESNLETVDLRDSVLSRAGNLKEKKVLVFDAHTDFQRVDVVEVVTHGSAWGLEKDDVMPDRLVFLDSVMQSNRYGMEGYHEALVQPAMFSHPNPRRVAIIGGGEGATLREVLKHKTVETCVMVEIDKGMVDLSREFLPEWSDCSDFVGSNGSCLDDDRAEVYYEDAHQWFISRYYDDPEPGTQFDVLIMDALDPSSSVPFSDVLYGDPKFVRSLLNSLSDSGTFVIQVGVANDLSEPAIHMSTDSILLDFIKLVEENGAQAMKSYVESHGRFGAPWDFRILFKNGASKRLFYENQAYLESQIAQRGVMTKSGVNPFAFFSGSDMMHYQYPSRVEEETHCGEAASVECQKGRGFDPYISLVPNSSVELAQRDRKGIATTESFQQGSYVALDQRVHSVLMMPSTFAMASDMRRANDFGLSWETVLSYSSNVGSETDFFGEPAITLDTEVTFAETAPCNGTQRLSGRSSEGSEEDMKKLENRPTLQVFFSSFVDRNHFTEMSTGERLLSSFRSLCLTNLV